jgi:hypothetical protein
VCYEGRFKSSSRSIPRHPGNGEQEPGAIASRSPRHAGLLAVVWVRCLVRVRLSVDCCAVNKITPIMATTPKQCHKFSYTKVGIHVL